MIKGLDLLIGSASKSNFWQYVNCIIKGNLIDFEIEKNDFLIKGFNFLIGSASKSNFWQYFNCGIKGNSNDFEIEKNSVYSGFKFINKIRFEIQFLAMFSLRYKRKFN